MSRSPVSRLLEEPLSLGANALWNSRPNVGGHDMAQFDAICETGHPIWGGPLRDTYQEAKDDASVHDAEIHGGVETAIVNTHP